MEVEPVRHTIIHKKHQRFTSSQIQNRRFRAELVSGIDLYKYRKGKKQHRTVWADPTLNTLYWGVPDKVSLPSGRFNVIKASNSISINSITAVVVDRRWNTSSDKRFQSRFSEAPDLCVSVITPNRTLDLEAPTKAARDTWAAALANVVFKEKEEFCFGDEEDDFDSDEDDTDALRKADKEIGDSSIATTSDASGLGGTMSTSGATVAGPATEAYNKVYRRPSLTPDLMKDIQTQRSRKRRTNSLVTRELMESDTRFRRLAKFIQSVREEFEADRGALYLVNRQTLTVNSMIIEGQQGEAVSLPVGRDLVGWVAERGQMIIVPDAYEDQRFTSRDRDKTLCYKTTSVIAAPVKDEANRVIAVLQFVNRQDHPYTKDWFSVKHASRLLQICQELKNILAEIRDFELQQTLNNIADLNRRPSRESLRGLRYDVDSAFESNTSQNATPDDSVEDDGANIEPGKTRVGTADHAGGNV